MVNEVWLACREGGKVKGQVSSQHNHRLIFNNSSTSFDPLGQPTQSRPAIGSLFSKMSFVPTFQNLVKQNNVRYWLDYGSGRVDLQEQ